MNRIPSFRKFNYSLRPGKNIERKMLAELFGRLAVFRPVAEYCYIGLGSIYFTDFALFHRQWGFSPMFSIEGDTEGIERALFNVPFDCVQVLSGRTENHLPTMSFSYPTIVWLDYDYELSNTVLQDVQTVVQRQCEAGYSGVVILVTVDVESERLSNPKSVDDDQLEDWPDDPVEQFRMLVGETNIPANISRIDLRPPDLATTYQKLITNKIHGTLADISGWNYSQFANFRYADGAEMATFGGLIYKEGDEESQANARFESLNYFRDGSEPYWIRNPLLTFREMHLLSRAIENSEAAKEIPITDEDKQRFKELYRYIPAYVEAEL